MPDYTQAFVDHQLSDFITELKAQLAGTPPAASDLGHAFVPYGSDHLKTCARCGKAREDARHA